MVKGYHLHPSCHPLLFHNFKQFNIKAVIAYCTIIKKELDQLLAKDAIKYSIGGAAFTQMFFVVLCILVLNDLYAILSNSVTT